MAIKFKIKTGKALKGLNNIQGEVPFVNAIAINDTAIGAQEAIRKRIAKEFIVRRDKFIMRSVKIEKFAKKRDQSALIAIVPPGNAADVLSQHEWGGAKTALGGSVAVPTSDIQPDRTKIIRAAKRPRRLKGTFKMQSSTSGKTLLAQKTRKGLTFPYVLVPSVPIRPRLEFVKTARRYVNANWVRIWDEKWRKTIRKKYL
jgi:hypothetical protein